MYMNMQKYAKFLYITLEGKSEKLVVFQTEVLFSLPRQKTKLQNSKKGIVIIMTRREAREALFTLIYEMSFHKENGAGEIFEKEAEQRALDDPYISTGLSGTFEHIDEIDSFISQNAIGWKLERLSRVSHAILRLGCYEMIYTDLPVKIAINEAVELAKKYDHDQAPSFVNGILNSIADKNDLKNKPENK